MPKIKTNRAAAKRFRVTGTGKIKRNKAYKRHILSSKGKKQKLLVFLRAHPEELRPYSLKLLENGNRPGLSARPVH